MVTTGIYNLLATTWKWIMVNDMVLGKSWGVWREDLLYQQKFESASMCLSEAIQQQKHTNRRRYQEERTDGT